MDWNIFLNYVPLVGFSNFLLVQILHLFDSQQDREEESFDLGGDPQRAASCKATASKSGKSIQWLEGRNVLFLPALITCYYCEQETLQIEVMTNIPWATFLLYP